MKQYHKIQTVYKRDENNNYKTLLEGQYSLPEFDFLRKVMWAFTEKVDGTNIRILRDSADGPIEVRGKSDNAQVPSELFDKLTEKVEAFTTRSINEMFGDKPFCLYGEGYGPKIQTGGKYRENQDIVLFDVLVGDYWVGRDSLIDIASKLGFDVVPDIGFGTLADMVAKASRGFQSRWGDFEAEGIVARPYVELKNAKNGRIITKIKSKDFVQ